MENRKFHFRGEFINWCIEQHDVVCNQKYAGNLPYSFHLKMVVQQARKFEYLTLAGGHFEDLENGCFGHDLIEDARITYNDIKELIGEDVANIIYACTEEKGRNRKERKSDKFYEELKQNKLAVFVKLCDIMANMKFGLLECSEKFNKSKKEWPNIRQHLFCEEYKDMFECIDKLIQF